jgi:hypothetical protein
VRRVHRGQTPECPIGSPSSCAAGLP